MLSTLLCTLALVPLAAGGDGKDGASFSINASDADGNAGASIGGKGKAAN